MTRRLFIFDTPDRFVTGTVGQPGQRQFYLQARKGPRVVSVSLEKVQVAVLAERLGALLDELDRRGMAESAPLVDPDPVTDAKPLDEPLNEAFRAGTLTLGWDGDDEQVIVEAREGGEEDPEEAAEAAELPDDDEDGPDLVRVRLTADAARAFVDRTVRVLAAGRPPCPLCGEPLDPQGHLCPRRNGAYLH
jgi:uncharacterized repeat protein (TIGR03847 family)